MIFLNLQIQMSIIGASYTPYRVLLRFVWELGGYTKKVQKDKTIPETDHFQVI